MHGRNVWRVDKGSQHPSTRVELDERGQVQRCASGRASKGYVEEIGANARRIQRVGNRVFAGRLTSGITNSSEYKHAMFCTHACHAVSGCPSLKRASAARVPGRNPKDSQRVRHRDNLAFAEGRLVLLEPGAKTTPSDVPGFRRPFLFDLTGPTSPPREAFSCAAALSSACSLLATSWYSSIVSSTAHVRHE